MHIGRIGASREGMEHRHVVDQPTKDSSSNSHNSSSSPGRVTTCRWDHPTPPGTPDVKLN